MLKATAKTLLPRSVIASYRSLRLAIARRTNARRDARTVFTEIYDKCLWGRRNGSGRGSSESAATAYVATIRHFIAEHRIKSVVDLGWGDFQVGSRLQVPGVKYVGVDIVPSLIERHRLQGAMDDATFFCLDICRDDLPDAELCLIRQVFQHLSNNEIIAVLSKLNKYQFVIVTEHYPAFLHVANRDKPHGADTRLIEGSAVCLDEPPFGINVTLLLDVQPPEYLLAPGETVKSFLLANNIGRD